MKGRGAKAEYTVSARALDQETTRWLVVQAQLLLVKGGTVVSIFRDTVSPGVVVAGPGSASPHLGGELMALKRGAYSAVETIRPVEFSVCDDMASQVPPGRYQLYAELWAEEPHDPADLAPVEVVDSVLWGPSEVVLA